MARGDLLSSPHRLATFLVIICFISFLLTLFYSEIIPIPTQIRELDFPVPRVSFERPSHFTDSELTAGDNTSTPYSHSDGTYASAFKTSYVPGADDVFLMIKTGATVLWQRLPIHLSTTLPQLRHFALYSDAADVIAGIPVIDVLENVSSTIKQSDQFDTYRKQQDLLAQHANIELYESKAEIDGGWNLDKYKNLPMVAHAYRTMPSAKWYVFMDADSYILWPNLMRWLKRINHEDKLYMGSVAYLEGEPFAHGGSGVIMSHALVSSVFGGDEPDIEHKYEEYTSWHCCGDHVLAHAFNERGTGVVSGESYPYVSWRIQGEPPVSVRYNKQNWCNEIVTFHHLSSHDVEKLYEFENQFDVNEAIKYADVYHHFIMPYIQEGVIEEWDNLSEARQYSKDREDDQENPQVTAYNSFDDCSKKCDEWNDCLQFRFKPGYCGLCSHVRLGTKDVNQDQTDRFKSKWKIDRIRNMRKQSGCDDIEKFSTEGSFFQT
ncbi:hypothetical protein V1514DRAFT_370284 [Lipomyces japonicus]|uniref:uncharacterized protein n=1 Tax=Lipomyces japonicus TaxID=56871 RepID=UPI0034CEC575